MYKEAKTAKGFDGEIIKVGDTIECISYYTKKPLGVKVVVEKMWKQGMDGTIVKTVPAPNPDYPHYFSHRASMAIKI